MIDFGELPILVNCVAFALAGVAVWFAGTRLATHADAVAELTGLGHALIGLLLLAGVTSLPEIAVSISSGWTGNAALGVNNLLGGVALQVTIIAIGDAVLRGRALTHVVGRPSVLLQGVFGCILLTAVIAALAVGDVGLFTHGRFGLGVWSLGLLAGAVALMAIVARERDHSGWQPVDPPSPGDVPDEGSAKPETLARALAGVAVTGGVIVVAGFVLARAGEALAGQTGLGSSFTGVALVGFATSLPEISTVVAAVQLKRYMMAFADIFGTNVITVALIAVVDIAAPGPPVLNRLAQEGGSAFATLAAALGILLTLVYLAGLVERRDRTLGPLGNDSALVVALYAGGLVLLFQLR